MSSMPIHSYWESSEATGVPPLPVAPGILVSDDSATNLAPVYREGAHGRILTHYTSAPLPKTVCVYSPADERPRLYAAVDLMAEFLVNNGMTPSVLGVVGDQPIVDPQPNALS
jgi:hypothetical protein